MPNNLITAASPCTLCGSHKAIVLAARVRTGERLRTVLCAGCGLGRRDPMPSAAELQQYYGQQYRVEMGKGRRPSKRRLWRHARIALARAEDLLRRTPPPLKSMDIGCGAGELVFLLAAAGCDARGFDPDSSYIQWARGLVGERVAAAGIDDVVVAPASLDLVTMYHVLEHMRDPRAVLERCARWLRPGGLLVVEVPHVESTVQGPGHLYHKPHLYYFNRHTLEVMASQAGLRLEEGAAFDRGENLRCYFRREEPAPPPLPPSRENVERILRILAGHTRPAHYTSLHPYRRAWGRFSRTLSEAWHSRSRREAAILEEHADKLRHRLGLAAAG